jgi:hypothetical protein
MDRDEKILAEIKSLKDSIAQVIGTNDLPAKEKFSKSALDKAAKEFQKLSIERGEWVDGYSIYKVIKDAPHNAGKIIREEFGFTNCFKRGSAHYYNRKDLLALAKELKKRNVNLKRLVELREDQSKFSKYLATVFADKDQKLLRRKFSIPDDVRDINTSPAKLPDLDVMQAEIEKLKKEFFEHKLSEYIDIYRENYAHCKDVWRFKRFLDPVVRRRIFRWIEDFNLANGVIEEITKKREKFIPVPEDKMIEL